MGRGGSKRAIGKNKVKQMRELLDIQGANSNWNKDEYNRGVYDGMEVMLSVVEDRKPEYRDKKPKFDKRVFSEIPKMPRKKRKAIIKRFKKWIKHIGRKFESFIIGLFPDKKEPKKLIERTEDTRPPYRAFPPESLHDEIMTILKSPMVKEDNIFKGDNERES